MDCSRIPHGTYEWLPIGKHKVAGRTNVKTEWASICGEADLAIAPCPAAPGIGWSCAMHGGAELRAGGPARYDLHTRLACVVDNEHTLRRKSEAEGDRQ
jgi:hypothetical protein